MLDIVNAVLVEHKVRSAVPVEAYWIDQVIHLDLFLCLCNQLVMF